MGRRRREYLLLIGLSMLGGVAGCTDDSDAEDEIGSNGVGEENEATEEENTNQDDTTDSEYINQIDRQAVLEYGETARISTGVEVTVHGITLYDQMGDEQPEERDTFAVVQVSTENTSDEQRDLPANTSGWEIFYGDQQIGQTFNVSALRAENYEGLDGGTVQGGVTREGVLLFEVDEGFDDNEIDTIWFDNFQFIEESGQRIDVLWTANP